MITAPTNGLNVDAMNTAAKIAAAVSTRHRGTVKWFSTARGNGFIVADDPQISDGRDIFVHYSGIIGDGHRNLYDGDRVTFTLHDFGKGPQARNVARIINEYDGQNGQGTRPACLHA